MLLAKKPKYIYLYLFLATCIVFWWSPSIIIRWYGYEDVVKDETIYISLLAFFCYSIGYLIGTNNHGSFIRYDETLVLKINDASKKITILLTIPSIILAIQFYLFRSNLNYGEGDGLPFIYQAFFYSQLSFFFIYISSANETEKNTLIFNSIIFLSVLIRLIVSLKWGRFFLIQALFPVAIVYLARGWFKITPKNVIILMLGAAFVFFVPAYFRGDFNPQQELGAPNILNAQLEKTIEYMKASSTLRLFQDNMDINLDNWCNPLAISLTQKVVPYNALGICTLDIWRTEGLPATLDRILAYNELGPETAKEVLNGPGSNYLLESYVSLGGITGIILVSFVFGYICAYSFVSLQRATIFGSLWIEILTRATLAPRGNIGYVFERIPMLLVTVFILIFLVQFIYKSEANKTS